MILFIILTVSVATQNFKLFEQPISYNPYNRISQALVIARVTTSPIYLLAKAMCKPEHLGSVL